MTFPPRVAFSWNGLPQYAARLMRAAIDRLGVECDVVGSHPSVPVEGMESALGQKIHWVDADARLKWRDLGLPVPDLFFQSGWSYPAFSALGREVKAAGGRVIGLSDANWRGDFRQLVLGPLAFRLALRSNFDAMFVPGQQAQRLMRYFGMPADRIRMGMYGADHGLFHGGSPLPQRPKRFLYVGQFIPRKNVLHLAEAFLRFSARHPGWELHLVGSGRQRDDIPRAPNIVVSDFVQPEYLSQCYRNARFFILPSKVEAWGLVVHEAALCGCALLVSDTVGAGPDLCTPENSICFGPLGEQGIEQALEDAARLSEAELFAAEATSRALAAQFGPLRFAEEVERMVAQFCN